jgi:hypothetical protein
MPHNSITSVASFYGGPFSTFEILLSTLLSFRFPVPMMMTIRFKTVILITTALALFGSPIAAVAADFGNSKDIKQVRSVVSSKFGKVLHVSVANDWALCTAYSEKDESDLSVVLQRAGASWKIKQSDGGAFDKDTLRSLGVPTADIPSLLKAYQ